MNRFFYWLADKLRPLHRNGLSEELAFPEMEMEHFHRGHMLRSARLGLPMGEFTIIGRDKLDRAARAWRPRELHLMEDVSLAFRLVDEQRKRAILVEPSHIDRLVVTLQNYLCHIGEQVESAQVRRLVNDWLEANSDPNAELAREADRPIDIDHPLWDELRVVDRELAQRFPGLFGGLADLGLQLDQELDSHRYSWCTPNNCRTFAGTGGEGVHFSFLLLEGTINEKTPVVLTTPADMGRSQILGSDLHEFLCLGCLRGYFALEYVSEESLEPFLDANWQPTESHHYALDLDVKPEKQARLGYLRERLNLRPWTEPHRFRELQEKYLPMLQLPPDVAPQGTT